MTTYASVVNVRDTSGYMVVVELEGVTVLMSLLDPVSGEYTAVAQDVTDALGEANFDLALGDYIVTIAKDGYTFSVNNEAVLVVDPATTDVPASANLFWVEGAYFEPDFEPRALFVDADFCAMSLVLSDLQGQPLTGVEIYIRSVGRPQVKTGISGLQVGILEQGLTAVTDSTGRASADGSGVIRLLRSLLVEVAIQGTGITRRVTIPDADTAEFFALLNATTDTFDVIQVAPLAVPRDSP
jgi:hypothetical protein